MYKLLTLVMMFSVGQAQSDVYLRDIGVIGLASHDMFAWDRENEVNTENGRLDLSTIFDYNSGKRWKKGGNPKNGENAPVWSITTRLVDYYRALLKTHTHKQARKLTVDYFHRQIRESFERMTGLNFPTEAKNLAVTNTEQAAMRGLHDILPGRVELYRRFGRDFKVTSFFKRKLYLNDLELDQIIPYYNGDYDQEYQEIKIPLIPVVIDLKKADRDFIEKFSPYKQEQMLAELKLVGEGVLQIHEVSFIHHIYKLFQKGICSKGNEWIPETITCH